MNERDDLPIRQAFDQLTPSDAAKARMRRRLTAVQSAPAPRRQWVLPLTAAVCTALALAAVLLLPKPDAVPTAPAGSDDASTDAEIAVIDKDAMTLIQKYRRPPMPALCTAAQRKSTLPMWGKNSPT